MKHTQLTQSLFTIRNVHFRGMVGDKHGAEWERYGRTLKHSKPPTPPFMLRCWWYHSNCPCSNSISPQFHISEEERLWQKASSLSRAGQAISRGNGYLTSNLNSINEMLLRADSLSCFYTADANHLFPYVCVCEKDLLRPVLKAMQCKFNGPHNPREPPAVRFVPLTDSMQVTLVFIHRDPGN